MSETTEAAPETGPAIVVTNALGEVDTPPARETTEPTGGDDPPAEAEDTEEAAASETPDADDAGAEPEPKKAKGVQKRIDELTGNWRNAERERDHWRELAMRTMQSAGQPQPAAQPTQTGAVPAAPAPASLPPDIAAQLGPRPDPAQYPAGEFDPRYTVDLAKYEFRAEAAQAAAQQRMTYAQQAERQFAQRLDAIIEEGHSKFGRDDFDTAMNGIDALRSPQLGPVLRRAIAEADSPADVAMALARDTAAQERISKARSPEAVARVIGQLEARLSAPPQPKSPSAPPPPPSVRGRGQGTPSLSDIAEKGDYETYKRLRMGR